jgi:hypothetical protein
MGNENYLKWKEKNGFEGECYDESILRKMYYLEIRIDGLELLESLKKEKRNIFR